MQRTAALLFLLSLAEAAASQLVINEVGIAPTGGNGSQFTELFNRSGCAVDLSCYTLVFSSTSGGGNATGWTVKIPSGKSIAAGGYFLIGGTAGSAGVSGGTGYPTGGAANSFTGTADVDVGTTQMTANAVYMKQFLAAGSFPNTKGQLSLLDATGSPVASVSYNNGNNAASYPLSAYVTCNASGNAQGVNNVPDPGASVNNVNATFIPATAQGIFLSSSGTYLAETSLTPRASNAGNGGTQLCSGPVLSSVNNVAVCFSGSSQNTTLPYSASNTPTAYGLTWSAVASGYFAAVNNAPLSGNVSISVPGNTPPGVYTGFLTLIDACGNSCPKPFTLSVNPLPVVNTVTYAPVCVNSAPVTLTGTPGGGTFTGSGVSGTSFTPPAAGAYYITYSYTDAATGCTNNATTVIYVSAPAASTYTTACTSSTPYVFYGQPLTSPGLHTVLVNNANGCTDTARIYLTVKETTAIDTPACDSVIYNGTAYYNDTTLTQTISSAVTACDSVVKIIRIRVNKPSAKDTTVCLPANGALTLLGQTFSASGNYTLHTLTAAGCDSTVRLHLTVATAQTQAHTGCDSVRVNGQSFYSSASFTDTLRSSAGCDSLIRTHNVVIHRTAHTYLNVCLPAGQTYNFNGQTLTASGDYTATLAGTQCDSIVHLQLLIAQQRSIAYRACKSYTLNGIVYTASATVMDTLRSLVSGCDSVYQNVQIIIQPLPPVFTSACMAQGGSYIFNGQALTATGYYTTTYTTAAGCDSTVNLYLVVSKRQNQTVTGCGAVVYKGVAYTASTTVTDTLRSAVTQCDSLIYAVAIVVNKNPPLTVSKDTTICLGGMAVLTASSPGATITWTGFGAGNRITVSPQSATQYKATVLDTNGCTNTATVRVAVDNFSLRLLTSNASVLSGSAVPIQSAGTLPYTVQAWQPASLFANQAAKEQRIYPDSSVVVAAVAQTASGCIDTAFLPLTVIPLDDVYIPSAFTPNGDGLNDEVRMMGTGIKERHFKIFNRWGQLVFSTTDRGKGWDGKFAGVLQPTGTYVYVISVKKTSGQVVEKKGTVTLIR